MNDHPLMTADADRKIATTLNLDVTVLDGIMTVLENVDVL